MSAGFVSIVD